MTRVVSMPGRGRLAGAVRTQQPEDLAPVDDEVQVVDGLEVGAGIDLRQAGGANDRSLRGGPIG